MFNVLEDQRIESLMGKLWLANNKRFRQTKRKLGKQRKKKITNSPVDMLLMVRFYRTDLVKDTKYFEELKKSLANAYQHEGLSLIHIPVYFGQDEMGGMGAYGSWNVGNWVDDVQASYLKVKI